MNPLKNYWDQPQVEYLGFLITRDEIKPQVKNVQGILAVKVPRSSSAAERMHLTAADMLRTMVFSGENWKEELDIVLKSVA